MEGWEEEAEQGTHSRRIREVWNKVLKSPTLSVS